MKVTLHNGFFYFAFRLHILFFCVARRTPTGGQSSESDGLSGAPVLPCAADSGEFHTHGNERSGLQREWVRERGWMWNRNSGRRDKRCMHGRALIQSQVYESQVSLMPSSAEEEKENHHTGQESVGFVQDTKMWHSGGTNHVKTMLITGDFNLLHGIFVHVRVEKCLTWEFENQLAKYNYANVPGVTQIVGFTSIM